MGLLDGGRKTERNWLQAAHMRNPLWGKDSWDKYELPLLKQRRALRSAFQVIAAICFCGDEALVT